MSVLLVASSDIGGRMDQSVTSVGLIVSDLMQQGLEQVYKKAFTMWGRTVVTCHA